MKTLKPIITAFITGLLLSFVGLAQASIDVKLKTASGFEKLETAGYQQKTVFNLLFHQGKIGFSYDAASGSPVATKRGGNAASKSKGVIHVTKDGVALPPGAKHKIPDNYVQNPHRSGNYGEIVNGKFKERLRIDPPTPPGQKGPNYSHYHKNGKGTHYSPRPGDKDPGF